MPPEKPKRRVSFSGSSHERERDPDNEYEEFAESDDEYATNANTAYGHSMYMSLPQVSTSCAFGRSWALLLSCDTHCRFVCLLQLCLQLKAYRATCRRFRLISQTFFSTVTSKMSVLESASHMVY